MKLVWCMPVMRFIPYYRPASFGSLRLFLGDHWGAHPRRNCVGGNRKSSKKLYRFGRKAGFTPPTFNLPHLRTLNTPVVHVYFGERRENLKGFYRNRAKGEIVKNYQAKLDAFWRANPPELLASKLTCQRKLTISNMILHLQNSTDLFFHCHVGFQGGHIRQLKNRQAILFFSTGSHTRRFCRLFSTWNDGRWKSIFRFRLINWSISLLVPSRQIWVRVLRND